MGKWFKKIWEFGNWISLGIGIQKWTLIGKQKYRLFGNWNQLSVNWDSEAPLVLWCENPENHICSTFNYMYMEGTAFTTHPIMLWDAEDKSNMESSTESTESTNDKGNYRNIHPEINSKALNFISFLLFIIFCILWCFVCFMISSRFVRIWSFKKEKFEASHSDFNHASSWCNIIS